MGTASVTYPNFILGQASDPDQVDQNFADLIAFLNDSVLHLDGTKTMTAALPLLAASPTSDSHAARKKYVDDLVAQGSAASVIDQDTSLGTDTVSALAVEQEWGSGGAQVVTIANPSRKVSIHAFLTGDATADASAGLGGTRLAISIDGGATYTYGRMTDYYCPALQPTAFACQHARTGVTPTGSIKVYAEIKQTGGTIGDITWNGGNIVVRVVPAI